MIGQDVEILKALAEREGVPVLLLSQLSRAGELLGTGDIERKANLVINLERKKLETDTTFGGRIVPAGRLSPQTVAHVEKQTFGETGDAKLMFNGQRFLFADLAK
jgi:replicative DNA helicase